MSDVDAHSLVEEQKAYYRARAGEYDEWWERTGRFDLGPEHTSQWRAEQAEVHAALDGFGARGRVLELACGTGNFTRLLARTASSLVAVDASAETQAIARTKLDDPSIAPVELVIADLFTWTPPPAAFDVVFFGFWLSHVPASRFASFWSMVRSALAPGGRVFFVDSLLGPDDDPALDVSDRELNDGRTFRIVKKRWSPDALAHELSALGWEADVRATPRFFVHGTATSTT